MRAADQGGAQQSLSALLDDDAAVLYDEAPCGLVSTTPDGTIVRCNRTFRELVGRPSEALVGRVRFAELLTRGGQIWFETHYAPTLRMHGRAHEIAFEVARPDGGRVPVLVNATVEHDAAGVPVVVRAAVFEAGQRRDYEHELLEQSRRLAASEGRARALASTLQQTLLPPLTPHIAGLDLGAVYRPAGDGSEVGGDFYDIFQTGPESWVVVLGDVCGKGVDAAVLTALSRYSLRAAAMQDPSPAHALTVLNDVLLADNSDRHATVACLRLDRQSGDWEVRAAFAGHPLALLRHPDGTVAAFGAPGQAVGILPDIEVPETRTFLQPGAALLLYTDGVPEARRGKQFFGDRRVVDALGHELVTAQQCLDLLLAQVLAFQGSVSSDDIACVLVRAEQATVPGTS